MDGEFGLPVVLCVDGDNHVDSLVAESIQGNVVTGQLDLLCIIVRMALCSLDPSLSPLLQQMSHCAAVLVGVSHTVGGYLGPLLTRQHTQESSQNRMALLSLHFLDMLGCHFSCIC